MTDHFDYVIVGGGSAGSALANGLSADPGLVARARGRAPDTRLIPYPHAGPAALPDRGPLLRLEARVRAGAAHGRPPGHHARGRSRGPLQHRRMTPSGPTRSTTRRGARGRPGAGLRPAALLQAEETTTAGADAWRRLRPLVLARGPAARRSSGPSSKRSSRPASRTDDVNGYRQEGFAKFDRNVHRGRRLSASQAYLHPVRTRKNLTIRTLAHVTGLRTQGNRVPASTTCAAAPPPSPLAR